MYPDFISSSDMANATTKQYNNFAKDFSKIATKQNIVNIKAIYEQFNFSLKNKKLIDLGCGDGENLVHYQTKGAEVYGIDASKELVKIAKSKLPVADIRVEFFEKLSFKRNYFDVVVSKYAMQHSSKIEPIYKEVVRVLKKDGIFIFLVTHPVRQIFEKQQKSKDYFKQVMVESLILDGQLTVKELSHTFSEYLSEYFFKHFEIISFIEKVDPSAEKIDGHTYPGFMIIKAKKK